MKSEDILTATLKAMRLRITRTFPDQVRAALAELSDEQIWWRPNEQSNSVGNLVLHVTGSLNHYLNRQIGGIIYERDRAAEFAERKKVPRAELLAHFDEMVSDAGKTFEKLTLERAGEPSLEPRMSSIVAEDIVGIATHLSTHVGQILWITKMLRAGALDEVWVKTHRESAWRPEKSEAK
jgi:uncharacterized damage-inducible protein DinB